MSWNTKSVKYLAELGYVTEITEHYNSFSGRKADFGGYIDAISLNPDTPKTVLGVQITSRSNISARFRKMTATKLKDTKTGEMKPNSIPERAKRWLNCGCELWIIGWESNKPKDRDGKIRKITLDENQNFVYSEVEINTGEENGKCNTRRNKKSTKA